MWIKRGDLRLNFDRGVDFYLEVDYLSSILSAYDGRVQRKVETNDSKLTEK